MLKRASLILLIFFSLNACLAQEQTGPYFWDFGRLKEGEIVKHEFTLKNETAKTLVIKDVIASCGCTIPEVKKKSIPAGESTSIQVVFNSQGYSGLIQQYVYVHTDNPVQPVLSFTIKAEVAK
ncbi:MAG: DUF1573 domain-containing protein [Candidatus Omnitrophota bacterium]|jgi:hypothetical protein